jgi:acetate kinase
MKYLIANIGSSSKKYAAYMDERELGTFWYEGHEAQGAFARMLDASFSKGLASSTMEYAAVGIRIVAPGTFFQKHAQIDGAYVERLKSLQEEDPLHITPILTEIESIRARLGDIPILGLSDSAFHADLPKAAHLYGLPTEDAERADIWRFGYHGFSVASIVQSLKGMGSLPEKLVIAHLGSGASVTALKHGASIETSMGFSPLEGLIMQTRSGSVDAAALLRLARVKHLSLQELESYLYTQSGLRGLSGRSGDVRELLHLEHEGDARAALALEAFSYRVRLSIGASAAALGGIDTLVLTGTIGECSPLMRERICRELGFLGLSLDAKKNNSESGTADIGTETGNVFAMHTEEMQEMARAARELLSRGTTR